jgi:hypothetical protein
MKAPLFIVFSLTAIFLLTSCAGPAPVSQPTPDVDAIVAQTMAALTEVPPAATPLASPSTPSVLPRSLYFLAPDAAAHTQLFRLERDGKTVKQITAEPADVESFDVNQKDGRVVYISNNQMLLINADGSGRQMLLDGGVKDVNNHF